ncbi:amidohydrolase [Nocardia sp. SSK8]|uniref:amidohydrolase n=1 Tax=Nocardia sp. SSK8 TaxID=3120154 RepID=UPI0030099BB7
MSDVVLVARTVITMDPARPRAEAVAVSGGRVVEVGSVARCRTAVAADAPVVDTGAAALLPGFVEPHGHPFLGGVSTQPPVGLIAPWVAPTWADVVAVFQRALASTDPAEPLVFSGFDALLHEHAAPDAAELDQIFGDRLAAVLDNSGHAIYFGTALIERYGWAETPPPDPEGGHFGRKPDGSLDGQGFEVPVLGAVMYPLIEHLDDPLRAGALFLAEMSRAGYTSTSDMAYNPDQKPAYEALVATVSCPLRVSLWEMSTTDTYVETDTFAAGDEMLRKAGVKLWTDGSVWVGSAATSYPYLDSEATRRANIDPRTAGGTGALNYSRADLDAILDKAAPAGWQMSFHSNGDLAVELALDAYEAALRRYDLLGTDHRWRIEHVGGATRAQLDRAASLGLYLSMSPFQTYFWGDLLDGQIFDHAHGSRWQPTGDALATGACVSLHNDGPVSPPSPLTNIQTVVTRRTRAGTVHGADQAIPLDAALRAQTIDAARTLRREHLVGSIEIGKLADFVELSADPYAIDPTQLATIEVRGTWLGGHRIDLDAFLAGLPTPTAPNPQPPLGRCC